MKKLTPNDARGLEADELADGARWALFGLAVKALSAHGKEFALEKLTAIADEAAQVQFLITITSKRTVIIRQLNEGESSIRLVEQVINTPPPARPDDAPGAFH